MQQFDISDPFKPVLNATVELPHPNMMRLSRDDRRLYVTNSLLTTWDDDTRFGPARNNDYGIWRFDVDRNDREADAAHQQQQPVGQLRERPEEDDDWTGRTAHDALRPEHPAAAGGALRRE